MSYDKEKIYELLPAIYRILDKKKKNHLDLQLTNNLDSLNSDFGPLEALVDVVSKEIQRIENDIFDLYENQYIETSDDWVAPYIGDLVCSTYLSNTKDLPISRKSYIANTISNRRRKGTLLALEKISQDVTLWHSKSIEYFKILITNQNLNHPRPDNLDTVNLNNKEQLDLINTPFDTLSHNIDVGDIEKKEGLYNIPNIGIFLYRSISFPIDNSPAYNHGNGQFSFHPLV